MDRSPGSEDLSNRLPGLSRAGGQILVCAAGPVGVKTRLPLNLIEIQEVFQA
jgi:hypothetical protein